MYLRIHDLTSVHLHEPDDCNRLHIEVPVDCDIVAAISLLVESGWAKVGDSTPGAVHLDTTVLRAAVLARCEADDDRAARFDAMLEYARRRGWYDERDRTVTAHISAI